METKSHIAAAQYRKDYSRQVHLVNYWPGHPARYIPVIVNERDLKPKKATLYSPEHDAVELDLGRYRQGWIALVPEINTYGLVVFE